MAARNGGRGQRSASPALWAPGPPHLSVPLISDPLDLNLFPPHLLRGFSVPGRGGDRWVAGGGSPHTVLMNGLAPALSSWSAGHLLHSHLLGGGHERTVSQAALSPAPWVHRPGPQHPETRRQCQLQPQNEDTVATRRDDMRHQAQLDLTLRAQDSGQALSTPSLLPSGSRSDRGRGVAWLLRSGS